MKINLQSILAEMTFISETNFYARDNFKIPFQFLIPIILFAFQFMAKLFHITPLIGKSIYTNAREEYRPKHYQYTTHREEIRACKMFEDKYIDYFSPILYDTLITDLHLHSLATKRNGKFPRHNLQWESLMHLTPHESLFKHVQISQWT